MNVRLKLTFLDLTLMLIEKEKCFAKWSLVQTCMHQYS